MTAPDLTASVVDKPGIYTDMPAEVYHADPVRHGSLSSSGARLLLPPEGCPAKFYDRITHPEAPKDHFDLGSAAHHMILGVGAQPRELDFANRRTDAYKDAAAEARAAGQIPLLPEQMEVVQDMASVMYDHPFAAALFTPGTGVPEQSFFWREDFWWRGGDHQMHRRQLWRRARLDWLSQQRLKDGRLVIPDYKTAVSSEPNEWLRAALRHGYHQQAPWYIDALVACGLAEDKDEVAFLFVVQEKTRPYPVTLIELPSDAMMWGRELNNKAMSVYAECRRTKHWPGYSEQIEMPAFPAYAEYLYEGIVNE